MPVIGSLHRTLQSIINTQKHLILGTTVERTVVLASNKVCVGFAEVPLSTMSTLVSCAPSGSVGEVICCQYTHLPYL